MDFTDLMQTQEIEPAPEEEQPDTAEKSSKKEGHTLSFLLTVQWAVSLFAAIAFLGVRFFLPEQEPLRYANSCSSRMFSPFRGLHFPKRA